MNDVFSYIVFGMWVLSMVLPLLLIILALFLKEFNAIGPLSYLLVIGIFTGYVTFIPIYSLIASDFIDFKKNGNYEEN